MKRRLTAVGIVCAAALAAFVAVTTITTSPPTDNKPKFETDLPRFTFAEPGARLPDVAFANGDGEKASLADFSGRLVLVNLWATWCAPCVVELPMLVELSQRYDAREFALVAISTGAEGPEDIAAFLAEKKIGPLDVYVDAEKGVRRNFKYEGLPTSYLVAPDGALLGTLTGDAEWTGPEATALIEHYLGK